MHIIMEGMKTMYHIAICDDDKKFIEYMKRCIKFSKKSEQFEVIFYEYYSGEELIKDMDAVKQYDLLILDMQLGGMDGDDTAKLFRNRFPDAVLVFCSGVRQPTIRSFKATPFRYLLKSHSDEKIISEMKEILEEVEKRSKDNYILGHYRNNMLRVNVKNILYIENAKRGSKIIVSPNCGEALFGEKILVDDKLMKISEKFPDLVFAHNSYIVNINHVEYLNSKELMLDSGEKLSISRMYQKTFREKFTKSIANKY